MVTKVAENLYTIPVPLPGNPLKSLNVYVVKGDRNLLVDTGFRQEECRAALVSGLRELGISMENTDIFLTHLHSDHTGLAPELAGKNTKIFIGEYDLGRLPGKESTFSWADTDRRFAAEGFPTELLEVLKSSNPAKSLSPVPYDGYIPVHDGQEFHYGGHLFKALLTPGHTPGHLCLWEEQTGICILGDHVLFDITPNITRWTGLCDSLGMYLDSLQKIDALPVTLPLPAHRAVHVEFHQRCQDILRHHHIRCEEVLNILSDGQPRTAWDITAGMTWRIRAKNWSDFPTPQKWFAVGEALAHLDHLIALGLLRRFQEHDLFYYQLIKEDTRPWH